MSTVREELAERLKKFRDASGMTIYEVGEKVGRSGKTVSAWENGRGQPDADMLVKLCSLYNIGSVAEMYGEEMSFPGLSPLEENVIRKFRALNSDGREKVMGYVEDMSSVARYVQKISVR